MSLLEKLDQKKAQKEQQKQAEKIQEKKQSFEQINSQVIALTEKKQRIISLKNDLRRGYDSGENKLRDFKSQKETLKTAYEDNREILEEEGIENFEEMLETNAEEPEVRNYRNAGGRKPSKKESAKISAGEAGETGQLYKAVSSITDIKNSLQAEMPEGVKLNFSAVTRKDEELNNRELSFSQIDEYLESLEKDIAELEEQKKDAYLKTPEGVREALSKDVSPEWILRENNFNNPDRFEIKDWIFKLSEKTGLEPIKEIYTDTLNTRLEKIVWENKRQMAIKHHSDLEQLSNEEKRQITELSRGAVGKRFAEAQERYFTYQNKKILESLDHARELGTNLDTAIKYLDNHSNLKDPELSKRKIRIAADSWKGSQIYEAGSEYEPIRKSGAAARDKINEYTDTHIREMEREINKLRLATIVLGRNSKIEKLEKRKRIFEDFKKDKPLKESELTSLGIDPEEIAEMKEMRQEKNETDKNYRHYDDNRIKFFTAIDTEKLALPITEDDILNNQEMGFDELSGRLQKRFDEINTYLNNLPEPEKTINEERKRLSREVEETEKKFKEIFKKNIEIIEKNR